MENKSLEWIILVTEKYKESRKFYHETLGLDIIREAREEAFTQFKLANCFLAIYGRKGYEKLIGKKYSGRSGGAIYTFAEVEDVDAVYDELTAKGVTFIKPPATQSWGQRTAYFTDPDGHIWELQQWKNK